MFSKILFSILKIVMVIGVLGAMGCGVNDNSQEATALTDEERARFKEIAGNSWTEQEKEGALHFLLSLEATRVGSEKTYSATASPPTGTREEKIEFFRKTDDNLLPYFKKGLAQGWVVQDEVLDKIHPQLKQHFHEEYIKGLEFRVDNTGDNWQPFYEGQKTYGNWVRWLTDHREELDIPYEMAT